MRGAVALALCLVVLGGCATHAASDLSQPGLIAGCEAGDAKQCIWIVLQYQDGLDENALLDYARRGLPANGDAAYNRALYGILLRRFGREDDGWRQIRLASDSDPELPATLLKIGLMYMAAPEGFQGDPGAGIEHLEVARALASPASEVHFRSVAALGFASGMDGDPQSAAQYFEEALTLRPNEPALQFLSGYFAMESGKFDLAILRLKESLASDICTKEAYGALGEAYGALGEEKAAARFKALFESASGSKPCEASYFIWKSKTLLQEIHAMIESLRPAP